VKHFFHKNAVIGGAEIICRLPIILTLGVLARSVGAETFGNWALVLTFQAFIAAVGGLGLSMAISRLASVCKVEEANGLLLYAFGLCALCLIIMGMLTIPLHDVIGLSLGIRPGLRGLLPLAILLAVGAVADGLLNAFFKARIAVGRQVLYIFARTLAELAAVTLIFVVDLFPLHSTASKLAGYIYLTAAGKLALYPWLLLDIRSKHRFPDPAGRREFLRCGLPMVPASLIVWLIGQSDRLVLSHFSSKHDLGIYTIGATFASYLAFLGFAVFPLLLPRASQLYDAGNMTGVHKLFQQSQRLFTVLWASAMIVLALWGDYIISWTAGPEYVAAKTVLLILAFATGIDQLFGISEYAIYIAKRVDVAVWLYASHAILLLAGLFVAGITLGIGIAPWTILAATIAFNVLRSVVARRYLAIPVSPIIFIEVLAAAVVTAGLSYFAFAFGVTFRLFLTGAAAVVLGMLAWKRFANNKDEERTKGLNPAETIDASVF
jgi:O-antigen/teichoic acid export membrane protein